MERVLQLSNYVTAEKYVAFTIELCRLTYVFCAIYAKYAL